MKKLLLFVLLFWSVASQAQDFPAYQSASTPNYRYRFLGAVQSDKGFINGVYTDTTSANSGYIDFHEGAQIWTTSDKKFWLRDSVNNIWLLQGINTNETRLVSGGVVSWDSLLKFSVSPAVYYVNGILYTSPQTALTLDPANATFDRIDIIYLDETGAHKLTGDAAASPAEPNLPPNSIRLTAIQVAALATTPTGIDTTIIYDENVEWTGAATSVTTNFAGTIGVCHFVKTTDLGAVTSASYIQYTRTSPIRISRFTLLKFSLSLKAAFANGTQLQISWRRAGVLKSTTINLANNTFGYLRTTSGCQTITIPLSAWSFLSDSIDQIRFQFTGSNASGCYIDWVQLQGISQSAQPAGQRFGVSGEDAVMTQNRYTNFHDQNFMNFDSVNSFVITARDTRFKNLSGQDWLSKTFANVTQMKDDNNQIRYYQDNVGSAGGTSILSADGGKVVTVTDSKVWLFANNVGDSIGSTVLPYNSGTQVVEMVQDTISGKWYRKTAGGGTPTLQQVFDTEVGGSLLTKNDTIDTGSKYLMVRRTSGAATALIVEGGGSVGINVSTTASTAAIIGAGGDGGAVGGSFSIAPAATNTFLPVLKVNRQTSGTAANGLGGYIQFDNEAADGAQYHTARIGSVHTDVTNKSGELQFWTSLTNTESLRATLSNTGLILSTRLQKIQGADVASVAGAVALGLDGNIFEITGTNAITLISNLNWQNGSEVTFLFTSTASLTDGTANSGTDIGMELNANTNFTGSAGASITLVLSEIGGTQRWREKCRSVN